MKISLLEYLDKLEATAKAASEGRWTEVNDWKSTSPNAPIDTIETTRAPRNSAEAASWGNGRPVHVQIASMGDDYENSDANRAHILATQPEATLALIAKLREAVDAIEFLDASAGFTDSRVAGMLRQLREIEVPE